MGALRSHEDYMAMAIALSYRARGNTGPNPNVGCVIVNEGEIVGRGWTQISGRPHAEAMALEMATDKAKGADIYTTLEPCAHESSRGPTCTTSIINAKAKRLICAIQDPDPRTNGQGFAKIRAAGIDVIEGIESPKARIAMAPFLMRSEHGRPFVTLKLAISLDGSIALHDGSSQWITGAIARNHGHLERAHHDAILVGSGTVKADNPSLNVRLKGLEERSPVRYQLGTSPAPSGWESLTNINSLKEIPHNSILVEGGAQTAAAFMKADLVDRILLYRAPIILGGRPCLNDYGLEHLNDAHDIWQLQKTLMLGKDRLEIYERRAKA